MVCHRDSKWMWLVLMVSTTVCPSIHAASKSATIGIAAEVLPACSAGSTVPATLGQFGTLDFGTHFNLAAQVTVVGTAGAGALRVNCLTSTPYRVLISAGGSGNVNARRMTGPSAAQVSYNLYTSATYATVWDNSIGVTGTGNGQDQLLPVYGRVPVQAAPLSGTYTDTVTVTVSW
ncbi:spore coat U domain-containing protein [Pseudomonas solani]|uniref:Spore coat U domain-containing protein n=2 Tax=Pseudomonas solani TaxID=2731552 RepID=A0AAU7Y6E6_9PSED|nr:hypothetical protein L682_11680 [Pseudomonas alcaligenes OT 69]MDN4146083.1 spore coat U domain-containing protein [Pseudomonas tohonis]